MTEIPEMNLKPPSPCSMKIWYFRIKMLFCPFRNVDENFRLDGDALVEEADRDGGIPKITEIHFLKLRNYSEKRKNIRILRDAMEAL